MQVPGLLSLAFKDAAGYLARAALLQKLGYGLNISSKLQPNARERLSHRSCLALVRQYASLPPHTVVNMPALSPTMSQGNLAKWHVKPGDEVKPGTVLADVETDKATLAFENQDEGFVAKLLVPDGARDILVGQPLAVLVEDAESVGAFANFSAGGEPPASASASAAAAPAPAPSSSSSSSSPPAAAAAAGGPQAYPPHTPLTMPSLSPTMDRGNIVDWKVRPGDPIRPGTVLADIETDKATLAFENVSEEGYLAAILVPAGSRDVPIGTPVALIVEEQEAVSAFADYGASGAAPAAPAAAAAPSAPPRVVANSRLGPAARILLAAAGLSPADVTPTGPNNIITKGDVLAAIAAGVRPAAAVPAAKPAAPAAVKPPPTPAKPVVAAPAATAAAPAAAAPSVAPAKPAAPARPGAARQSYTDTPNSQIRRIIAQRLLDSKRNTPGMYLSVDARLDAVAELRAAMAGKGLKVSVNDCVMRAVALALRDVPAANVRWDEAAGRAVPFGSVDISFAVATERGLITPIVRAADAKGLSALSREVRSLALRARDNKLKPEEFTGGSFTVSNLGMYGMSHFSAIINPPQAGILAIGGAQERVVLRDGQPAAVSVMTVTLSADSRVYDGELAGAVLEAFRNHLERPFELVGSS